MDFMPDAPKLLDALANGIMIIDEDFNVKHWNEWLEINTMIRCDQITDKNLRDFYPDIDYKVLSRKIRTALSLNVSTFYDASLQNRFIDIPRTKITTSFMTTMQLQVTVSPYLSDQRLVMISIYDISDLYELKLTLQHQMQKIADLNEELQRDKKIIDSNLMIVKIDSMCRILESTDEFNRFFGLSAETALHFDLESLFREEMRGMDAESIKQAVEQHTKWSGEVQARKQSGEKVWLDVVLNPMGENEGSEQQYTVIFHDITDKKRIELLSITDPLTKLFNRNKFNEVFEHMSMRKHWNEEHSFAFLICDVDHFKRINDTYGHPKGDEVLIMVANMLSTTMRTGDIVARWGGEEFVSLIPDVNLEKALFVAEKLRLSLAALEIPEVGHISASFGVSLYHEGDTKESLIHRGDEALYHAKQNGRNRVEFL